MEEQLISYKTAKLAKEKGFENKTPHKLHRNYYNHLGKLNGDVTEYIKAFLKKEDTTNFDTIDASSQSLLQKWLREKHNVHIHVWFDIDAEYNNSYIGAIDIIGKSITLDNKKTYEESLEECLYEALKLLTT